MAVVGMTGSGKSTLMARLVPSLPDSVILQTKLQDDVQWPGKLIRRASDIEDARFDRFVLNPRYEQQYAESRDVLDRTWKHKGWLLVIDEMFYLQDILGIKHEVTRLLTQGRSMGLTAMMGMQRPVDVSRFVLSQASHLIIFRQDGRDAKTLVEAASMPREMVDRLARLREHEFLWYSVPRRAVFQGYLQDLEGRGVTDG